MPQVNVSPNCGNSPKMQFLRDLNIAFAKKNAEDILARVTDDIVWDIVGDRRIEGKSAFSHALQTMNSTDVTTITIETIITHGKYGSANGIIDLKDGSQVAFSDVYHFTSATGKAIKLIKSFNIALQPPSEHTD